jgi:hypothetical protein
MQHCYCKSSIQQVGYFQKKTGIKFKEEEGWRSVGPIVWDLLYGCKNL